VHRSTDDNLILTQSVKYSLCTDGITGFAGSRKNGIMLTRLPVLTSSSSASRTNEIRWISSRADRGFKKGRGRQEVPRWHPGTKPQQKVWGVRSWWSLQIILQWNSELLWKNTKLIWWRCFTKHKPHTDAERAEKCLFVPGDLDLWPLIFDFDLQTHPSKGQNTSSLWIWRKFAQRLPKAPKTEHYAIRCVVL